VLMTFSRLRNKHTRRSVCKSCWTAACETDERRGCVTFLGKRKLGNVSRFARGCHCSIWNQGFNIAPLRAERLHRTPTPGDAVKPSPGATDFANYFLANRCSTAARSSRNSCSVALMRDCENSLIERPCTISYLPFLIVTG